VILSRGFSLAEVLVVTAILAVTGAMTLPSFVDTDAIRCSREAGRLGALVDGAARESLLSGRAVSVVLAADGYRFEVRDRDGGWTPVREGSLPANRYPDGIRMAFAQVDGNALGPDGRLAFSPVGDHPPFLIELAHQAGRVRIVGSGIGESHVETR
jgi:prepilin-type N-terminal cleavage/methylation domain-containing protein